MPETGEDALQRVVAVVKSSPKYSRLAEGFIRSTARTELNKGRSFKEAVKATRNKLHQVAGVYLSEDMRYPHMLASLRAARESGDPQSLREACRQAMHRHTSTRERLGFLESFYSETLADIQPVRSVLDVACGLNPLAIPWMSLAEGTRYHAVDVYLPMVDFLNSWFGIINVQGRAWAADVIESPPQEQVDLALVLKSIPCLEQSRREAGSILLSSLNARHLLVTFPAKSLGGRQKGMVANYEKRFSELAAGRNWRIRRFEFPTELAFLAST